MKDKGDEEVLRPYFNTREIKHMEDVKLLFKNGYILKYISFILSLIIILVSIKNKNGKWKKNFLWAIYMVGTKHY